MSVDSDDDSTQVESETGKIPGGRAFFRLLVYAFSVMIVWLSVSSNGISLKVSRVTSPCSSIFWVWHPSALSTMPNDIAQYKIPDSDEVYYIPNFITVCNTLEYCRWDYNWASVKGRRRGTSDSKGQHLGNFFVVCMIPGMVLSMPVTRSKKRPNPSGRNCQIAGAHTLRNPLVVPALIRPFLQAADLG